MKTVPEIVAEIEAYRPALVPTIRQMAAERNIDPDLLTPGEYARLLNEEAEWSEKTAKSVALDDEERAGERAHAAAVRAIVARILA